MFAKVALFASAILVGGVSAYNGLAYPYNPSGHTFECGVPNNANVVFVSAARFDATLCGHRIQASSPYGLGDTIYPTLAGVVRCNNCSVNDIQLTQTSYKALTKNLPGQPYASVVWVNWN
ncbi:hypothetical protein HDZ31DRAFT_63280 [Schizophyllum fasciatum]